MSAGTELPEDIQNELQNIVSRCEAKNIPPNNLHHREFTPDDLQSKYDKVFKQIKSHNDAYSTIAWKFLEKNTQLDPNRESKYRLYDMAVISKNNSVFDKYPSLDNLDQSSLKIVPKQADMNKDGFNFRNHYLIFCSRLSQNYRLTGKLRTLRSDTVDLSVPISYSKLGLPNTIQISTLLEHWRGPETIDELRSRAGHNFFVQKGSESYEHGLQDRTEFLFEKRNNNWHLQIEELLPRMGISYSPHTQFRGENIRYNTRYLHAILNKDCERCFHIDGAIRGYGTAEKFIERHVSYELRDSNLLKKTSTRHKLFKLDSSVGDITEFGEVAGLFFKHNPHVQRFFEGDSDYATEIEESRIDLFKLDFGKRDILSEFKS